MSVKAIVESPHERPRTPPEEPLGPSEIRQDDLSVSRSIGLVAACLVLLGGLIIVVNWSGRTTAIGPGVASIMLVLGLLGLLFHASVDRELEFRQIYRVLGWAMLVVGAFLSFLPYPKNAGDMFSTGYLLMAVGLLFQIAPLRNETDPYWRNATQWILGGAGGIMAVFGLLGGFWFADSNKDFLLPIGLLVAVLGLVYLVACVVSKGISDNLSYRVGLGIGALGLLVFVLALVRSLWPGLFRSGPSSFLLPWGILLLGMGLCYLLVSVGLISESRLVAMTRRELGAFFYSPLAYLVLLGVVVCQWVDYVAALGELLRDRSSQEPIVGIFLFGIAPVFFVMFAVPALTMRLLSEERRTGTLEVTLTTPVNDVHIVLSKFFAAWLMYLLLWVPLGLYLIAFRIGVNKDFDYRPVLGFSLTAMVMGAMFVSMGLFFSSLTRNQVISGVMSFAGMLVLTMIFIFKQILAAPQDAMRGLPTPENGWVVVLRHVSYLDLWRDTVQGQILLRQFVFPVTVTILWLFLTTKVLEARKWL